MNHHGLLDGVLGFFALLGFIPAAAATSARRAGTGESWNGHKTNTRETEKKFFHNGPTIRRLGKKSTGNVTKATA